MAMHHIARSHRQTPYLACLVSITWSSTYIDRYVTVVKERLVTEINPTRTLESGCGFRSETNTICTCTYVWIKETCIVVFTWKCDWVVKQLQLCFHLAPSKATQCIIQLLIHLASSFCGFAPQLHHTKYQSIAGNAK